MVQSLIELAFRHFLDILLKNSASFILLQRDMNLLVLLNLLRLLTPQYLHGVLTPRAAWHDPLLERKGLTLDAGSPSHAGARGVSHRREHWEVQV